MIQRVTELIQRLQLEPHPEGGYYREIWRAGLEVMPADGRGPRSALTLIYFLLPAGAVSRWHRVRSDEIWHFCEGAPLELTQSDGTSTSRFQLGPLGPDQVPVHTVPAGTWQTARSVGDYSLVSCSVGPGFDFADFELLPAADAAPMQGGASKTVPPSAQLELVTLVVREYDPAIAFFVEVLGFDLVEDLPSTTTDGRPKRWVVVRPRGGRTGILLARADGEEQEAIVGAQFAGRVGLFLRVHDFAATCDRLIAAGVEFVRPPRAEPYGTVAVFRDLEGNRWDLLGPAPGGGLPFAPTGMAVQRSGKE